MIATGADLAAISRQLGHANVGITLSTYTHFFEKRGNSGLGARMEELVKKEVGCDLVAIVPDEDQAVPQVIDLLVAREGIEPPTRGFSGRGSSRKVGSRTAECGSRGLGRRFRATSAYARPYMTGSKVVANHLFLHVVME